MELLYSETYHMGHPLTFNVYKSRENDLNYIDIGFAFEGEEEQIYRRIFYKDEAAAYQSPYLSWYNLVFCSNNYGPVPIVEYMNTSVQEGKKLAATVYPADIIDQQRMEREMPEDLFCVPFNPLEYQYMLYVCKEGCLADYFDLDRLLAVYESCDIKLDREKMENYFSMTLISFAANDGPVSLHYCEGNEEFAVVGLLFGYPIESTIALIRKDIVLCDEQAQNPEGDK